MITNAWLLVPILFAAAQLQAILELAQLYMALCREILSFIAYAVMASFESPTVASSVGSSLTSARMSRRTDQISSRVNQISFRVIQISSRSSTDVGRAAKI